MAVRGCGFRGLPLILKRMNNGNPPADSTIPVTVIVVTVNRPDCIWHCLSALECQKPQPQQVIVVDASQDDRTRWVVTEFPAVIYLSRPELFGCMTASRNAGLMHATGEIIAFVDDDAYARPGWLKNLIAAYDAPDVGAVGGRAMNAQPGEDRLGCEEIGRLKPNGFLTGYFAADPGRVVDVDHIIGCNMSFRREVLARLGGFREDSRGISGLCEDSDMSLRVKRLGYRLRFQPGAVVDHVGAPQAVGRRFSVMYEFYHRRNSFVLLLSNFGFSRVVLRFPLAITARVAYEFAHGVARAGARVVASCAGLVAGLFSGLAIVARNGLDPVRRDVAGRAIAAALEKGKSRDESIAA